MVEKLEASKAEAGRSEESKGFRDSHEDGDGECSKLNSRCYFSSSSRSTIAKKSQVNGGLRGIELGVSMPTMDQGDRKAESGREFYHHAS